MDTRVLVVGGAGYIGGAVTDRLMEKGIPFTVFDNLTYENHYLKPVDFIHGDIRDREKLSKIIPKYTHIIWLAALVGDGACAIRPQLTWEVNTEPVEWIAENFAGRIMFTSTCSVYGAHQTAVSEDSPTRPLSMYAQTKLAAEQALIEKDALVLRLGTAFGVPDAYSRIRMDLAINYMTMHALTQGVLTVYGGTQWRPFIHVRDIARIIVENLAAPHRGVFNVATHNCTIAELGNIIQRETGCRIEVTEQKFQDQRNYNADVTKARVAGILPEHTEFTIEHGINDIKRLTQNKRVKDFDHSTYSNQRYLEGIIEQYESGFMLTASFAKDPPQESASISPPEEPRLFEGGLSVDDRGYTSFVNNFLFEGVKRFYTVSNHAVGFVRAWHGHKRAGKYVYVPTGSALIGLVPIDDWDNPSKEAKVHRFVLSEKKPCILFIPPGYANGAMTLAPHTTILYFATDTLEETKNDDYRFGARYWDIWHIEER